MKRMKKFLALALSCTLVVGSAQPLGAFASEELAEEAVPGADTPQEVQSGRTAAQETEDIQNGAEENMAVESNGLHNLNVKVNYALDGTATAKGEYPANNWTADKAIDGIINRIDNPSEAQKKELSKWSHDGVSSSWLLVDLKESKTFDEFKIAWESDAYTASEFHIETSDTNADGSFTTVYSSGKRAGGWGADTDVVLENPVSARYVRLVVDGVAFTEWVNVSVFEFQILGDENHDNLAAGAAMTSNGNETADFTPEKSNDGDLETRWSSSRTHNEKWLCMDFGAEKTVASAVIEWQRKNASNYIVQSSVDGTNWKDQKQMTVIPTEFRDIINFDNPVSAQYIRVLVKEFNDRGENREGTVVPWDNVSILEFEAYDVKLPKDEPVNPTVPVYNPDTNKVKLPNIEGYTVTSNGADLEQIVAEDLSVHKPLTAKEVKMALRKVNNETSEETVTQEYTVTIPGLHEESTGNAKPQVIPEIAEWYSDSEESFTLDEGARIVIASEELRYVGEEFKKDLADVTGKNLELVVGAAESVKDKDIFFTLGSEDTAMGDEGYHMNIGASVKVDAVHTTGAYWSTRTILQALKLSEDGISMPRGEMRDYPKFKIRGFVLDVGRKAMSMETLENVAKNMAWYKMNDFQVHLSDNYIFLEDYKNASEPDPADGFAAYSGYRLESDIKNDEGKSIASEDYHYSKAEFKQFIQENRKIGINIVPEIDVPAHAMAITELFPEYAVNGWNPSNGDRSIVDHLDISKPEVVEFTKSIFDEYIEDGTFDADTVIHVGADEFEASATAYRNFLNQLIPYVKRTNTTRLWGGLSRIKDNPLTEIIPEAIQDVQINLWSTGWATPKEMYELGFDLINTLDGTSYMVPDGSGSQGGYKDYLNKTSLYSSFKPNVVGGTAIPAGDKQMLGSAYALWQDNIDKKASGLSEEDLFLRFFNALPLYAEKNWANGDEKGSLEAIDALTEKLSIAPNSNPYSEASYVDGEYAEYNFDDTMVKDDTANDRTLTNATNVETVELSKGKALEVKGGTSYLESPLRKLGSDGNSLSFTLKLDEVKPGQILFEEDSAYGTRDIRVTENNKLGFTRELYEYEFDYVLEPGTPVRLTIVSNSQTTSLYVNGIFTSNASGRFVNKGLVKKSNISNSSFTLPLQRIGSKENAFKGIIDQITVARAEGDAAKIPADGFEVTSDNAQALTENGKEGPVELAFDGRTDTIWHTQYSPSQKELPATVTIDLGQEYTIDRLSYMPRQGESTNGIATEYEISVSSDNSTYKSVLKGNMADDQTEKVLTFDPVAAHYVKFKVIQGMGGFGSAAEISLFRADGRSGLGVLISVAALYEKNDYSAETWEEFQKALKSANDAYQKEDATEAELSAALKTLQDAMNGLQEEAQTVDKSKLQTLYNGLKDKKNENYTTQSWEKFQKALTDAKAVLDKKDAAQSEVDKTKADLQSAADGLEKNQAQEADKSKLQTLYDGLKDKKNENYTTQSWEKFQKALTDAKAVLDKKGAAQSEVDQAKADLQSAADKLEKNPAAAVDKSELQGLYQSYAGLKEKDYTAESWTAFQKAYTQAKTVLDKANASQSEVNSTAAALKSAYGNLKKAPAPAPSVNKAALNTLYKNCAGLKAGSYTASTWQRFAKALSDAKNVLNSSSATQAQTDQAVKTLTDAKNALKKASKLPKKGSTYQDKKFKYKVTSATSKTKTVTLVRPRKENNTKVTVPNTVKINGYTFKVTGIADKAFKKNKKLRTVTLGAYVKQIGKESFRGCQKLKTVNIKSKYVTKIGKYAFKDIYMRAKISVPKKKSRSYNKLLKRSKLGSRVKIVKK